MYKPSLLSQQELRDFLKKFNAKNYSDYETIRENHKDKMPSYPNIFYKDKWLGWDYLLNRKRLSFKEIKKKLIDLGIRSLSLYRKVMKENGFPSSPNGFYKKEWVSWDDFFGRKQIVHINKNSIDILINLTGSNRTFVYDTIRKKEKNSMDLNQYIEKKKRNLTESEKTKIRDFICRGWDAERIAKKIGCVPIQVAGIKAAMSRSYHK